MLEPEMRVQAQRCIAANIEAWAAGLSQSVRVLGGYWAMRGEPDVLDVLRHWHDSGRLVVLPRVVAADAPLQFGRWTPSMVLRRAAFGVMEPEPFEAVLPEALLLPCVGFSEEGFRLGYGGGFYDRTLAARAVPTLGVAFECCRVEGFVAQSHDRALDALASEAGLRHWPREAGR